MIAFSSSYEAYLSNIFVLLLCGKTIYSNCDVSPFFHFSVIVSFADATLVHVCNCTSNLHICN